MSKWALKRKMLYFGIVFAIVLVWFFVAIMPKFRVAPTCFDRIQNGNESGIDCGGSCPLFCSVSALPLTTMWARSFEVIPGRYNAIAVVENQNTDTAISSIAYEFKLYDENNIFIARRTGETYITANNQTAIFEPGISVGERTPVRTDFSFIEQPLWLQIPKNVEKGLSVSVSNIVMEDPFTNPRLTATIKNNSRFDLYDFDVIAILYNGQNNVIAASTTFVEQLDEGQEYTTFFTWQDSFAEEPVRIELLPQVNVFDLNVYR